MLIAALIFKTHNLIIKVIHSWAYSSLITWRTLWLSYAKIVLFLHQIGNVLTVIKLNFFFTTYSILITTFYCTSSNNSSKLISSKLVLKRWMNLRGNKFCIASFLICQLCQWASESLYFLLLHIFHSFHGFFLKSLEILLT